MTQQPSLQWDESSSPRTPQTTTTTTTPPQRRVAHAALDISLLRLIFPDLNVSTIIEAYEMAREDQASSGSKGTTTALHAAMELLQSIEASDATASSTCSSSLSSDGYSAADEDFEAFLYPERTEELTTHKPDQTKNKHNPKAKLDIPFPWLFDRLCNPCVARTASDLTAFYSELYVPDVDCNSEDEAEEEARLRPSQHFFNAQGVMMLSSVFKEDEARADLTAHQKESIYTLIPVLLEQFKTKEVPPQTLVDDKEVHFSLGGAKVKHMSIDMDKVSVVPSPTTGYLRIKLNTLCVKLHPVSFKYKKKTFPGVCIKGRLKLKADNVSLDVVADAAFHPTKVVLHFSERHIRLGGFKASLEDSLLSGPVNLFMFLSEREVQQNLQQWIEDVLSRPLTL